MRVACKKCGNLLVPPAGNTKSKILLVGDFPGVDEVEQGAPFVGKVGGILRSELQRVGLNLYEFRVANLWQHRKKEECDLDWHVAQMVKEFKGRQFILTMGTEVCRMLFHKGVMELSGLEVKSDVYTDIRFFVAPIPPYVGPVGEFRLTLERFAAAVKKAKLA